MTVTTVIPCLNEEKTIGNLVESLRPYGKVIVVNDGSKDNTKNIAYNSGACIVNHNKPQGIGPSILHGWRKALEFDSILNNVNRIAVIDAGGSHQVEDLPRLLESRSGIVIGSRFVEGSSYVGGTKARRIGSKVAAIMCNLAQNGPWVHDWTSGYRIYNRDVVEYLLDQTYFANMHSWQIESLGLARSVSITIREVPITYISGESSFNISEVNTAFKTWLRVLHAMPKLPSYHYNWS